MEFQVNRRESFVYMKNSTDRLMNVCFVQYTITSKGTLQYMYIGANTQAFGYYSVAVIEPPCLRPFIKERVYLCSGESIVVGNCVSRPEAEKREQPRAHISGLRQESERTNRKQSELPYRKIKAALLQGEIRTLIRIVKDIHQVISVHNLLVL